VPRLDGLDVGDADDHVKNPEEGLISYPFKKQPGSSNEAGPSAKRKAEEEPASTGRCRVNSRKLRKYGVSNIPADLKHEISKISNTPKHWKNLFLKTGSCSISNSTWKKYASAFHAYKNFCRSEDVANMWPMEPDTVFCFIIWCRTELGLKAASIRAYLTGLGTISKFMGFENQISKKQLEKFLVRGLERADTTTVGSNRISHPMTFEILLRLRDVIEKKTWSELSKQVVWTACCLGYFGSFRASEILAESETVFDPHSNCTWTDIRMRNGNSALVTLKCPKSRNGKPEEVEVFEFSDTRFCPVIALKKLKRFLKKHGSYNPKNPVFSFASGKLLTVSKLSKLLKKMLAKTEFGHLNVTARSMRAGIPTDLESRPDLADDRHVKAWGRWRSGAYQRYMKKDQPPRAWVFGKISEMLTQFIASRPVGSSGRGQPPEADGQTPGQRIRN